jgi:hypothetical protein
MELRKIKNKQVINRLKKIKLNRNVLLRPVTYYKNILIISKKKHKIPSAVLKASFPNAEIYELNLHKPAKEEKIPQNQFSVNYSDFNLAGKLKNVNLSQQLKNKFDLIIDLSVDEPLLIACMFETNSPFIVGSLNARLVTYDLAINEGTSHETFIQNIVKQITLLTQKQNEQI